VLLRLLVIVQVTLVRRGDRGQTTAEYALVLVGVAAVALLLVAWASDTDKIGRLLDGVLDSILDRIP
jgi:Protein of unknown function (DUF4244)